MIEAINLGDTGHAYSGGSNNTNGHDGDFGTGHTGSGSGGSGSSFNVDLTSAHTFASRKNIKRIDYYLQASSSSNGDTDNGASAYSYIQTQDADTLAWTTVPGTSLSDSHNNGGGGGATGIANSANPASVTVDIQNVIAIKAFAGCAAYTNGGGSISGSAGIYEIQAYYEPAGMGFMFTLLGLAVSVFAGIMTWVG